MPLLFVAVPLAVVLAWFALRSGTSSAERAAARAAAAGGLEAGATGRLASAGQEEEPFRREFLRERPQMFGGEVGGPYGPLNNEIAPSAPEGGFAQSPQATQTFLLDSGGGGFVSGGSFVSGASSMGGSGAFESFIDTAVSATPPPSFLAPTPKAPTAGGTLTTQSGTIKQSSPTGSGRGGV